MENQPTTRKRDCPVRAHRFVFAPKAVAALVFCVFAPLGASPCAAELVDLSEYEALLAAHVRDSRIDYDGLAKERGRLEQYVTSLAGVSSDSLKRAPASERLAFWINAYNALLLSGIVESRPFPDNGLKDVPRIWTDPRWMVAGRRLSLNQIKGEELARKLNDPRVHFALASGALGGPVLRARAYKGASIDGDLEQAARRACADPAWVRIDEATTTVLLSEAFQWFGDDLASKYAPPEGLEERHGRKLGACLNFIALHLSSEAQPFIRSGQYRVRFVPFDWRPNDAAPRGDQTRGSAKDKRAATDRAPSDPPGDPHVADH